jgi:hypothetical protein
MVDDGDEGIRIWDEEREDLDQNFRQTKVDCVETGDKRAARLGPGQCRPTASRGLGGMDY